MITNNIIYNIIFLYTYNYILTIYTLQLHTIINTNTNTNKYKYLQFVINLMKLSIFHLVKTMNCIHILLIGALFSSEVISICHSLSKRINFFCEMSIP